MHRLSSPTVRLRLTLLYGALFLISGAVLLAITYVLFRNSTGVNLIVPGGPAKSDPNGALRQMAARWWVPTC